MRDSSQAAGVPTERCAAEYQALSLDCSFGYPVDSALLLLKTIRATLRVPTPPGPERRMRHPAQAPPRPLVCYGLLRIRWCATPHPTRARALTTTQPDSTSHSVGVVAQLNSSTSRACTDLPQSVPWRRHYACSKGARCAPTTALPSHKPPFTFCRTLVPHSHHSSMPLAKGYGNGVRCVHSDRPALRRRAGVGSGCFRDEVSVKPTQLHSSMSHLNLGPYLRHTCLR